ncbi:MAG: SPFH domain-containing protein [Candidatus Altiarchaeota archaeon]|nr:SPFH domain-containing protein [Candidatus Altiarchaeota archaeon]
MDIRTMKENLAKSTVVEAEIVFVIVAFTVMFLYFVPAARQYADAIVTLLAIFVIIQLLRVFGIIREIKEYERLVVFRFGHFHRVSGPGWIVILPILEKANRLDLRVQRMDLPPQEVITADEIRVRIDTIVYYRVKDPAKAIIKVQEFQETVSGYVFAALRDIASNLTLNELYGEIEKVNDIVKVKITPMTSDWGLEIIDVEVQNLKIPDTIQQAMHVRRQAKEEWAAAQYQARAQRTLIEALADAASKLDDKALSYLYITEAIPKLAEGASTKIIFPTNFPQMPQGVEKGTDEAMTLNLSGLLHEGDTLPEKLAKKKKKTTE